MKHHGPATGGMHGGHELRPHWKSASQRNRVGIHKLISMTKANGWGTRCSDSTDTGSHVILIIIIIVKCRQRRYLLDFDHGNCKSM